MLFVGPILDSKLGIFVFDFTEFVHLSDGFYTVDCIFFVFDDCDYADDGSNGPNTDGHSSATSRAHSSAEAVAYSTGCAGTWSCARAGTQLPEFRLPFLYIFSLCKGP